MNKDQLNKKIDHDIELINKMLEMQKKLDKDILVEYGLNYKDLSIEKYERALLDEIGELNHELKASWCWWKKTQKPIDNAKVLEELVDVWHFALSYHLVHPKMLNSNQTFSEYFKHCYKEEYLHESPKELWSRNLLCCVNISNSIYKLACLLITSEKLGFTIDDVYEMYIRKNQINHERVENGY